MTTVKVWPLNCIDYLAQPNFEIDMKKLIRLSYVAVAVAAALFAGCKSKQVVPSGEKEVVVPCSGPDFFTNNKVFRANSVGESMDQVTSKKKALTNARNPHQNERSSSGAVKPAPSSSIKMIVGRRCI